MDETAYRTLLGAARIAFHTRNGTIFDQIERAEAAALQARDENLTALAADHPETAATRPRGPPRRRGSVRGSRAEDMAQELEFWNGFGGFDRNGRDYVVRLTGGQSTPQPWVNVIANAGFGFHTSAEGASFTWSRNSRDFQLTPWSNDPVTNRPGEAIYIRDQASGRVFSPLAAVARDPAMTYEARHGQGFSTFSTKRGTLGVELTQLVDPADPVKISRLVLRNAGSVPAGCASTAMPNGCWESSRAAQPPMWCPPMTPPPRAVCHQPLQPRFRRPRRLPGQRSAAVQLHGRPPRILRHSRQLSTCRTWWPQAPICRSGWKPASIPARPWSATSRFPPAARRRCCG